MINASIRRTHLAKSRRRIPTFQPRSPVLRPFLPLHHNNIGDARRKNLALACQDESRTAKACRLPGRPRAAFFEIRRVLLADNVACPHRLAYQPCRAAETHPR